MVSLKGLTGIRNPSLSVSSEISLFALVMWAGIFLLMANEIHGSGSVSRFHPVPLCLGTREMSGGDGGRWLP